MIDFPTGYIERNRHVSTGQAETVRPHDAFIDVCHLGSLSGEVCQTVGIVYNVSYKAPAAAVVHASPEHGAIR